MIFRVFAVLLLAVGVIGSAKAGYVGNDPMNYTDPTGMARVCNGNENCVDVDANGDGDVADNDLTDEQNSAFGEHYSDFIDENNGKDLSGYGKDVRGSATETQKNAVRAASQFVGAAADAEGGRQSQAWDAIDFIDAQTRTFSFSAEAPAQIGRTAGGQTFVRITGRSMGGFNRNMYDNPSDLARFLIHEPRHLLYPSPIGRRAHRQLDAEARARLQSYGLAGGGCAGGFGFPSC